MKRINKYMMAAAVAILAAGCAKETAPEACVGEGVVFEASISDADAKAVLRPGKTASKVEWIKDDKVGVYAGTAYYEYKADKSSASSTLSPVGASSLASEYYAVYPYDASATLAGGVITTTLPAEQTAVLGSFSHHLAVAHSESLTLNFKNVCGLLCLDVAERNVVKVELKGNKNEILAGKIAVAVTETPSWAAVEGIQSVALVAPLGKELQVGDYYLAVLPQTFAEGVTVTTYFKDGSTFVKNVTDPVTVAPAGMVGGKVATGEWKVQYLLTGIGNNPEDIVLAPDGNFWVTTRGTVKGVWKYDVNANTNTVIASSSNTTLLVDSFPWGGDFDQNGLFYFAAKGNGGTYPSRILTCTSTGQVAEYSIGIPWDKNNIMKILCASDGTLYVLFRGASAGQGKVCKIKDNTVQYTWNLTSKLYEYICFNADQTKIFVLPNNSGDIQLIDLADNSLQKIAGTGTNHSNPATYTDGIPGDPFTATLMQCEGAICAPDGTLYFSEIKSTIRMFVPDANGDYSKGTIRTIVGKPYDTSVINYPNGIALGADGKTIYFTENGGKIGRAYFQKYE